jgi:hypothetical protein
MAEYPRRHEKIFGRAARFAVVPIETVRALNIRTDDQVVEAQKRVDEDMIRALEEMVNAAKAGRLLEGKNALAVAAIAW